MSDQLQSKIGAKDYTEWFQNNFLMLATQFESSEEHTTK